MAEFVQLGDVAINFEHVDFIHITDDEIILYFTGAPNEPYPLDGVEVETFRHWWGTKASVYKAL